MSKYVLRLYFGFSNGTLVFYGQLSAVDHYTVDSLWDEDTVV